MNAYDIQIYTYIYIPIALLLYMLCRTDESDPPATRTILARSKHCFSMRTGTAVCYIFLHAGDKHGRKKEWDLHGRGHEQAATLELVWQASTKDCCMLCMLIGTGSRWEEDNNNAEVPLPACFPNRTSHGAVLVLTGTVHAAVVTASWCTYRSTSINMATDSQYRVYWK